MQIIRDFQGYKKPLNGVALTIGNFDGVHLGHRALLQKVLSIARERGLIPAALTFEPHPIRVLMPEKAPKRICTPEHKLELINKCGIDLIFVIGFTFEFSRISAEEFLETVLINTIGVRELVVGYDYSFGKNRQGNVDFLREKSREYGYNFHVVDPVVVDGIVVSSSKIRELVSQGNIRLATSLLGHYYQIRGVVVRGKGRGGRLLGFPTANLNLYNEELCPKTGVYVVQVILDSVCYGGLLNIGYNPTFDGGVLTCETHILDFDGGDIYGKSIKINFIERIRDEMKFDSVDRLIEAIKKDIVIGREILRNEANLSIACKEG